MTIAAEPVPTAADPTAARRRWPWPLGAAVIVAAVFVAYLPVVHGTGVWDDDYMLTANPVLTAPGGLWRVWADPAAVPVYYPMTMTVLWVERHLFGLADLTGYHVVHTLLHGVNAVLVWRLLRRLRVPGAFAAGLLWGLHPVDVESVAWLTELKNTLSGFFYLLTMASLLRYYGVTDAGPRAPAGRPLKPGRWYLIALVLFPLALAAKTTAVTLPAAALLIVWWRAGRLRPGQVIAAVPLLIVAALAGAYTQHVETTYTGNWDPRWSLSPPQQLLVAGRAAWFYAAKLAWPAGLSFAYPKWHVDPSILWQWTYPVAAAVVIVGLWVGRRRIGRGPLTGVLFFAGTLVPALGFFHVLYQRYAYVADHFQYLAGIGLIALVTAGIARLPRPACIAIVALAAVTLGTLTAGSACRFDSDEAAWAAALTVDPANPFASLNVAKDRAERDPTVDVSTLLSRADADPLAADGAWALRGWQAERAAERATTPSAKGTAYRRAADCYGRAVSINPRDLRWRFHLGTVLLVLGDPAEAVPQLRLAADYAPVAAADRDNLGVALLQLGRRDEAAKQFRSAADLDPTLPNVRRHLASVEATH